MRLIARLLFLIAGCQAILANAATQSEALSAIQIENSYIVTFKPSSATQRSPIDPPGPNAAARGAPPPFGEHGTGQSKQALAAQLGIRGQVQRIFEAVNAAHLYMDSDDAARLAHDPRVLRVEQNLMGVPAQTTQQNPGWALDRIDQATTSLDARYQYNASGLGRTIYILDTGLDLSNPGVINEFGSRASVIWDVNNAGGADCYGHGTQVASAAAGRTRGVAKDAAVVVAKISQGCTGNTDAATWITAFNWLAVNARKGSIVNLSWGLALKDAPCGGTAFLQALDDSIRAAFNAGVIVVIAAGNDGCNTANYSPTRIPESFVVGASDSTRFASGQDARASYSRYGTNISTFAPGTNVALLYYNGASVLNSGTSFSAPYIAGLFAVACQAAGTLCDTMPNSKTAYDALRNIGRMGTVVNANGTALPSGTPSRFISRQPW